MQEGDLLGSPTMHLFSPHSFRVTVVTDLLNQNVPLEDVSISPGTPTRGPHRFMIAGGGA